MESNNLEEQFNITFEYWSDWRKHLSPEDIFMHIVGYDDSEIEAYKDDEEFGGIQEWVRICSDKLNIEHNTFVDRCTATFDATDASGDLTGSDGSVDAFIRVTYHSPFTKEQQIKYLIVDWKDHGHPTSLNRAWNIYRDRRDDGGHEWQVFAKEYLR